MAIPPVAVGRRQSGRLALRSHADCHQQYIHNEVGGGMTLLIAALAALAWANSPWEPSYHRFQETTMAVSIGLLSVCDLRHWINDGLMVLFFLWCDWNQT